MRYENKEKNREKELRRDEIDCSFGPRHSGFIYHTQPPSFYPHSSPGIFRIQDGMSLQLKHCCSLKFWNVLVYVASGKYCYTMW